MRRLLISIIVYLILAHTGNAQQAEKVFPLGKREPLFGISVTKDGHCYIAGAQNTLERSLDGGMTWEQLNTGEHQLHFIEMVTDGTDLYMIACPFLYSGRPDLLEGEAPLLLCRYDTQTGVLTNLPVPLPDRDYTSEIIYHSIAATQEAVFVSYRNTTRHTYGLVMSRDQGGTWQKLTLPDSLSDKEPTRLYTASGSGDVVVAAGSKIAISKNTGSSWDTLTAGNYDIMLYLGNAHVLLREYPSGRMLVNNTSGNWMNRGYAPIDEIAALHMMSGGSIVACGATGGILLSADTGRTWGSIYPEYKTPNYLHCDIACRGESSIIAVNALGEIYITQDMGVSWDIPRETPRTVAHIYHVADEHVYLSMTDRRNNETDYYISTDYFRTFHRVEVPGIRPSLVTRSLWYAFSGVGDTLVFVTTDGGVRWKASFVDAHARRLEAETMAADTTCFVVSTTEGLIQTTDRGSTWTWIQRANWSARVKPTDIQISPYDGSVWYTFKDTTGYNPYMVMRSNPDISSWNTVLELSAAERERMFVSSVLPLKNGVVLVIGMVEEGGKRNTMTWFSDDNGETWQSYEMYRSASDQEYRVDGGAKVFYNGQYAMRYSVNTTTDISNSTLYLSNDYGRTDTLIYETSTVANLRGKLTNYDPSSNVFYYYDPLSVHRISSPAITSVHNPDRQPLPLSIGTPYPHPVPSSAGTTMLIRSERPTQVSMTAIDLSGREAGRLFEGELGPDGRYVSWSTGTLVPGTYVLQLESGAGVCRRKVVVR